MCQVFRFALLLMKKKCILLELVVKHIPIIPAEGGRGQSGTHSKF